ncbi:TonB-dependent receptor [Stenotrophomonas maltophilia]|uniref:TonB-dependent receptor domain-containing protein n=1 Tax=Stenotrophomonas maltophilia TaxID=40324 RepID=UPI0019D4A3A4|nr:TonB-dependent receptor [Stenotrophomonas maltophilia]MBN7828253.1 TonB-dependent receptor [Stenotrophomonas maltophilia]MBN7832244.1 TonB-dependent receptor [Stenotrophomonas maltophilia]MBN7856719.1 TonB-dependent receptor [Stenotrophomonas maltophilia]MBO2904993.1 TonB-dependent receptor [Stenotrophomonas maltophilia]MBO2908073.1 TonB-dependent receptor [Stenotrophomonas maltophilia]
MRRHLLAAAILFAVHTAHAADAPTLPTLQVQASPLSRIDSRVTVDNPQAQNRTLGSVLEHVSGVQSSAFGPNAGAPVIRSLSGNRVQILQDGQSILGMNAISGDINIPFDPLFVRSVTVNKSSDAVRYGGNAIGGSVEIDSGLVPRRMGDKEQSMELILRKGFNAADAQGFRMNFNNQRNLSTNLQVSRQRISHYGIPGNSKSDVCNTRLFPPTGGVNSALADSCQKEARVQQIYKKASQPYIDQFMAENPDWADGDFSFYTNNPTSVWQRRTYINPVNPAYVPGTPSYVQKQINNDVTPDYHHRLGNSYARNSQVAFGSTLFFDRGYVGVSIDAKDSEYGMPGFSMQNLSFGSNDADGLPVGVVIKQERYALEALLRDPLPWFERAELRVSRLDNTSGEHLGSTRANDYDFESSQVELLLSHLRLGPLSGLLGFSHQSRQVTGGGSLRYLPDVDTRSNAVFLKEALDVGWATFDAGVRHERVDHELQPSRFRTARNAANTKLQDRSYRLNSYSVGSRVELGPLFAAKVRYASSQRAPEINELYASNAHYSVMTQEEGNQNLKPERAKNLELTGLFHIGGFELSATAYRMKYENYLYLGHSGLQTANRLPLKYWKQTDTTVKGFEIDASQALDLGRYGTLNISAFADLVKNKADHPDPLRAHNDGEYLPNMPTNRYGANLQWQREGWKAQLSSTYYDTQEYLGRNVSEEIPLDAFNLVDLQVSRELPVRSSYIAGMEVFVNGSNLLNEEARPHNSPLKYIAPLPGRGFQVGVTLKL